MRFIGVFALSAVAIYLIVLVGGATLFDWLDGPDVDGGRTMAIAFALAPAAALIGGILCAWLTRRR